MVSDRDFDPANLNPASRERSGRETPEEIQLGFDSNFFLAMGVILDLILFMT